MKKKLEIYIFLTLLASLIFFFSISVYFFNQKKITETENYLTGFINFITTQTIPTDILDYTKKICDSDSEHSIVVKIYNNNDDLESFSYNKNLDIDFENIKDLKNKPNPYYYKSTLGTAVVSYSNWEDYTIIIGKGVDNNNKFIIYLFFLILLILIVTFILTSFFLNKTITEEVEKFKNLFVFFKDSKINIKNINYDNFDGIHKDFCEMLKENKSNFQLLENKVDTVDQIINSMDQGLIMFDYNFKIVLINKKCKNILGIKNIIDYDILQLYRNSQFKICIEKLIATKETQYVQIKEGSLTYDFSMNYVEGKGYVILISDITELYRLEKMRSEFTSNVTHELKTPLTSISGFAELISLKAVTNYDQIIEYNGKILSESKRMINLVNDILKLSDIENGNSFSEEEFNIRELFLYAYEILKDQFLKKNISYEITGQLKMLASKDRIYELIFNLLGNAVKYNNEGGSVIVKIFESRYNCGFKIYDTGIGIPKKDMYRIFERFYRVDKARSRKVGGTGLGLSIVKHIVELYNGSVTVKAGDNGIGSVFVVTFPNNIKK